MHLIDPPEEFIIIKIGQNTRGGCFAPYSSTRGFYHHQDWPEHPQVCVPELRDPSIRYMRKKQLFQLSFLITSCIPFLIWSIKNINLDLWYDEIYTLRVYVFAPLIKTVSYYNTPNNHIFFNLLLNLYLKSLNISKITPVINSPSVIRILMLFYCLIGIYYFYKVGKILLNFLSSILAVVLLATTIPFINFSLQIRGYCLSTTLSILLVYHLLRFEEKSDWKNGLMIVFATALALYTIPSNLYFILSVMFFYFGYQIIRFEKYKRTSNSWLASIRLAVLDFPMRIIYLICASILLAVILYLPVLGEVINNPYVKSHGLFRFTTITQLMPQTFLYFIYGKWWLIPFVIIGLVAGLQSQGSKKFLYHVLFCLTLLIVPFLISSIRGDKPFGRTFVNLSFIMVLLVVLCLDKFIFSWKIPGTYSNWVMAALLVLNYGSAFWAEKQVDQHIFTDIITGNKSQDLLYNYFLEHYSPSKVLSHFASNGYDRSIPVYLVYEGDVIATRLYIGNNNIKFKAIDDTLAGLVPNASGEAYVITAFPNMFLSQLVNNLPGINCVILNDFDFVNVFKCQT
ncbi:MAG TPA: glycosyltransferase family 39 protein [Anaerolineaceae bacterium]|nr:glycosyltransferase family 39 protein [Anaerolineaceae bacterium]